MLKDHLGVPRSEVIGVFGYQWYFSSSDDLNDKVDVFDHISSYMDIVRAFGEVFRLHVRLLLNRSIKVWQPGP